MSHSVRIPVGNFGHLSFIALDPKEDLQRDKFSLKYVAIPPEKVPQFQQNFEREWGSIPENLIRRLKYALSASL